MSGMIAMRVRHLLRRSGSRLIEPAGETPGATPPPLPGYPQADAFTGYDRLFSAEREGGD